MNEYHDGGSNRVPPPPRPPSASVTPPGTGSLQARHLLIPREPQWENGSGPRRTMVVLEYVRTYITMRCLQESGRHYGMQISCTYVVDLNPIRKNKKLLESCALKKKNCEHKRTRAGTYLEWVPSSGRGRSLVNRLVTLALALGLASAPAPAA